MAGPFDDLFREGPFSGPSVSAPRRPPADKGVSRPTGRTQDPSTATLFLNPQFGDIFRRPTAGPVAQPADVAPTGDVIQPTAAPQVGPSPEFLQQIQALQAALGGQGGFLGGLQQQFGGLANPFGPFQPPRLNPQQLMQALQQELPSFLNQAQGQLQPSILQDPALAALFNPGNFGGPAGGGGNLQLNPAIIVQALMALQNAQNFQAPAPPVGGAA